MASSSRHPHYTLSIDHSDEHEAKSVKHKAARSQSTLREGASVKVFSRTVNEWVSGEVTKKIDDNLVQIEYQMGENRCSKGLHIDSAHLDISSSVNNSIGEEHDLESIHVACEFSGSGELQGVDLKQGTQLHDQKQVSIVSHTDFCEGKSEEDIASSIHEYDPGAPCLAALSRMACSPEDSNESDTDQDDQIPLRQSTAFEEEEDLPTVKARTMHGMVEECICSDGVCRKVLFLTNGQARLLAKGEGNLIKKLFKAFDFPNEPKLVINLLHSACPAHMFHYQNTPRLEKLGLSQLPYFSQGEALKDERKLIRFMRSVVIPIAVETNAIILCQAQKGDCLLAQALRHAVAMQREAWGSDCPFSIIGLSAHVPFYYECEDQNAVWSRIRDKCKAWKARDKTLSEINKNPNRRSIGHAMDIDETLCNLILVDTVEDQPQPKGLDTAPFLHLVAAIDRHLTSSMPYIAFKSGSTLPCSVSEPGPWRLQAVMDVLSQNCPVILLDTRVRGSTNFQQSSKKLEPMEEVGNASNSEQDSNDSEPMEKVRKELESFFDELERAGKRELHDAQCLAYLHSILEKELQIKQTDVSRRPLFDAIKQASDLTVKVARPTHMRSSPAERLAVTVVNWFVEELFHGRIAQIRTPLPPDYKAVWRKPWNSSAAGHDMEIPFRSSSGAFDSSQVHGPITAEPSRLMNVFQDVETIHQEKQQQPGRLNAAGDKESSDPEEMPGPMKEAMHEYAAQAVALLCHPMLHSVHADQVDKALEMVSELVRLKRLPQYETLAGLTLLRDAWDEFDVAMYHADWYKRTSIYSYLSVLILSILTVVLINFPFPFEFEQLDDITFCLSLGCSLLVSLSACVNPVSKWRHLRGSALGLESLVWKYRTRVGEFAESFGCQDTALSRFQNSLQHWRLDIMAGAGLQRTTLATDYKRSVCKHCQWAPITMEGQRLLTRRICWYSGWYSAVSVPRPQLDDNHYSPVDGQSYIMWRLKPSLETFKCRLLPISRWRSVWQFVIFLCSACSAFLTKFDEGKLLSTVAIVTSVSSAMRSWMEFRDVDRKLSGYSWAAQRLKNVETWWESLSDVEKSAPEKARRLVMKTESIIVSQYQAWVESMEAKGNSEPRAASRVQNVLHH